MSGWEHRPQAEIQMGNGTLLATFLANGELEQLFAPHIDALQSRLGGFRTSVLVPRHTDHGPVAPEILRLGHEDFNIRVRLDAGSQVLYADYHHKHRPIRLERKLGLHPVEAVILDQWKVLEGKVGLLHESIPWMGGTTSAQCSLFHPTFNGLVHHRGRRWLGILVRGETQWARVGHLSEHDRYRLWAGYQVGAPFGEQEISKFPAGPVRAGWDYVVQGPATWGALAVGPSDEMEFLIACGESERHLGRVKELMERIPVTRFFHIIEATVQKRQQPAAATLARINNASVRALCERSIDVLHALQDGRSGALMAAAEVDPHSRMSGGYGFSWPRDGAYLASALGAFGFRDRVEHYFRFLSETQDQSGTWWQRYLATGHAGPSWGRIQIDEPATVIGAALLHYKQTEDLFWLESFWPTIEKALQFLESFHSSEHPLGLPSHDLWEERMGVHAYSLAAVSSAFMSGAFLAKELLNRKAQSHYFKWARAIDGVLRDKFVPGKTAQDPVRRSFIVNTWDYMQGGGYWDEAPDVSMLGLITPFRVLPARHPAARAILDLVRSRLWCRPTGGVLRYQGDAYRGGNPWILTTLWLALVELELGNFAEARECFQWVMSKTTAQGMMAEQVHREGGNPFWVIPLGWSHAMYLLFVREVLDRNEQGRIWEAI